MNLEQIPLIAMLKGKLGYLNERQKLISQNVANADTPGYAPSDLKPFTFAEAMKAPTAASGGVEEARTNAAHLAGKTSHLSTWTTEVKPDSEARLDGNQVVLEDQMIKMGEARMDYDAAVGLYQKSLGLLRLAARRPGG
ncbi:MAG TPA: flagellar basal body rod protein FlgB [Caulobacteraceae bacterium]|jgi:flagellar basal-body rod protein FlgB|nr:flagellar basal body rod protein FlgB [Caulobacteraceae bacterium]